MERCLDERILLTVEGWTRARPPGREWNAIIAGIGFAV